MLSQQHIADPISPQRVAVATWVGPRASFDLPFESRFTEDHPAKMAGLSSCQRVASGVLPLTAHGPNL